MSETQENYWMALVPSPFPNRSVALDAAIVSLLEIKRVMSQQHDAGE
jgi:hypothetical protein